VIEESQENTKILTVTEGLWWTHPSKQSSKPPTKVKYEAL